MGVGSGLTFEKPFVRCSDPIEKFYMPLSMIHGLNIPRVVILSKYYGSFTPMTTPFVLAPMAELSHRPLREVLERFGGCDEYFTEMISAPALLAGGPWEGFYLSAEPKPEKVVYQLVGGEAETLVSAARILDERVCLGIDINMGCPAPEIVRQNAGVRWMTDIDRARHLVARLRSVVRHRLSVKIRLGYDENSEYLVKFCTALQNEGLDRVTLHPRTASEKLRRRGRWKYVDLLSSVLTIPVVGNGDVNTAEDLIRRSATTPGGVMVGRGAVRRPWIFAQAKSAEDPRVDILEITELFLASLELHQPPEFYRSRSQRFFFYFLDNLTWGHHIKTLVGRQETLADKERVIKTYLEEHPEDRYPRSHAYTVQQAPTLKT